MGSPILRLGCYKTKQFKNTCVHYINQVKLGQDKVVALLCSFLAMQRPTAKHIFICGILCVPLKQTVCNDKM